MGREDMFGTRSYTKGRRGITLFKDSGLYGHMRSLSKGERGLLDFMLKEMDDGLNTVILAGDTMQRCLEDTRLTKGTIEVFTSKLKKEGFIDKGILPYEYVIDPRLAVAGDEYSVYKSIAKVEEQRRERCK